MSKSVRVTLCMLAIMIFFSLSLVAHAAKRYLNYKTTAVSEVKNTANPDGRVPMAPAAAQNSSSGPSLGFDDRTGSWDVSGTSTTHVFQNTAEDPGAANLLNSDGSSE